MYGPVTSVAGRHGQPHPAPRAYSTDQVVLLRQCIPRISPPTAPSFATY